MSSYIERQTNSRTQTNALQSKKFRNNKENASEIRKTFTSYSILFASNHLHQFMAEFFSLKTSSVEDLDRQNVMLNSCLSAN